jgi:pyrroloquinoline quinone biosynthesis protein B
VVITAAEADTVAGLLSLRVFQPLDIYATPSVLRILRDDNSLFALLNRVPRQAVWQEIQPDVQFSVGQLDFQPFTLPGGFPGFVSSNSQSELAAGEAVLGLLIESPSGARLAYLPGVAKVEESWRGWLEECDVLLFDGTFWTEDELCRVRGGGKPASAMGHLPLSGPCGSLAALRDSHCSRKIFFHINNTNPILDESSPAYAEVRDAGWEVARDGMEIRI